MEQGWQELTNHEVLWQQPHSTACSTSDPAVQKLSINS